MLKKTISLLLVVMVFFSVTPYVIAMSADTDATIEVVSAVTCRGEQ